MSTQQRTFPTDGSSTSRLLNPASIRCMSRPGGEHVAAVLSSPRYSPVRENINRLVTRPDFAGYWVLRHSLTSPNAPADSDRTIFFLHGGGYFASQPAHYLLFLLRLAQSILEQSVSVSIFALDYSLAPEHNFPTQLEEAAAAYAYLIHEQRIPAGKIVVAGDSAGGHLALSLLVHLDKERLSYVQGKELPKPGGLVLMSPWLSLHHEAASFNTNAHLDVLSSPFLHRCARDFLGHELVARANLKGFNKNSPYLEFIRPEPTVDWEAVLPSWVWASAGRNEMFFDSVEAWAKERKGNRKVVFEVGVGRIHAWQYLETVMDESAKKAYLSGVLGDGRGFEATASIGRAIVERAKDV